MNNFTQGRKLFSFRFAIVALLLLSHISVLYAVRAYPYPVEVVQPDGTTLMVYLKGDEFCNYKTTLDGYLIAQDEQGFYKYAKLEENGSIVQTAVVATDIAYRTSEEKQLLTTLTPNPDFGQISMANRAKRAGARVQTDKPMKFPGTGSPKSLVILVEYADVEFTVPNPKEAFEKLLNEEGYVENGGTGSAKDYFKDSSNGLFDPDFVVVGPYKVSQRRVYYGANSGYNDDIRPREMVIEACQLAQADGVDFSEYDTDGDGLVDNVFIYYAGINEAESGVAETIWPHRWYLATTSSLILDGVAVYDYACTSEISGIQGSTQMCGIGTFIHEFGHVLGLPDFYVTNGYTHPTLEEWSVMDYGPYLNDGRTPPAYSAYERFFVGWMEPTVISEAGLLSLEALTSSNQAYIVTQDGEHNLNGADPSPREFIMLENRQNKGWDTYLPGHGMLVTRIVYNPSAWNNNTINNNSNSMGYELIRADNDYLSTTMGGDPFPGSEKIRSYDLTLRSGSSIERPLANITEINETVYFNFMNTEITKNGMGLMIEDNIRPFYYMQGKPADIQEIKVAVLGLDVDLELGEEVDIDFTLSSSREYAIKRTTDDEWYGGFNIFTKEGYMGDETISIRYTRKSYEVSEAFLIIKMNNKEVAKIPLTGYLLNHPQLEEPTDVTSNGFTINWEEVEHATGYYTTVVTMEDGESTFKEGFNRGLEAPEGWIISAHQIATSSTNCGEAFPAISLFKDDYIETEEYILPAKSVSFYMMNSNARGTVLLEGWKPEEGWSTIDEITPAGKTVSYDLERNYYSFRITFAGTSGNIYVDDFSIVFDKNIEYVIKNAWTEENFYTIDGLDADREYNYWVRASKRLSSEEVFAISEYITPFSSAGSLIPTNIENVELSARNILEEAFESGTPIKVFSIAGQKVAVVYSAEGMERLPKGQIYILQVGEARFKLAL